MEAASSEPARTEQDWKCYPRCFVGLGRSTENSFIMQEQLRLPTLDPVWAEEP